MVYYLSFFPHKASLTCCLSTKLPIIFIQGIEEIDKGGDASRQEAADPKRKSKISRDDVRRMGYCYRVKDTAGAYATTCDIGNLK